MTRVSITDTGGGIDAEKQARLFTPFDRLEIEGPRVEGTGLGLALAKRMVEHMGGAIGAESVVGQGSTFWVELPSTEAPVNQPDEPREPVPFTEAELPAETHVLLSIEDNASNVRLINRILARRPNIQLLDASTGELGLKMAREQGPDLILLDLHLPDIDGIQVLAELRADSRTSEVPVVILSANALPDTRKQLLEAGASMFLTKPIEVRSLLSAVDGLVGPQLPKEP
jgi:CheY-like chemotaxis protein